MAILNGIVKTIDNIINLYGGTCTIRSTSGEVYDPETSTTALEFTDYNVKMVAFDYLQRLSGTGAETNSLVRTGDKQLYVKLLNDQPMPNPVTDSVIYKGIRHNIITIKDTNPSGNYSYILELFIRE